MRVIWKKEEGLFGEDALILIFFAIGAFFLILAMNHYVVVAAWTGFIELMKPDKLYPSLLKNGAPNQDITIGNGFSSLLGGAIWIQQNIILRKFVNALFVIILLLVGIAYLYHDLFEQYLHTRMREFLPRIVFGLILAFSNIYILEMLMVLAKGAYVTLYNAPLGEFQLWQNANFLEFINLPQVHAHGILGYLDAISRAYLSFIWVFIGAMEALALLILVAVRDFMFAVLLVLLPIASLLIIHPWTQRIGSRLWWLIIDLTFLPIVMIIPLMLMGLVHNSIAFTIAGLTITIGALYLIAQEPFVLSGAGFTRGGAVLTAGLQGGALGGSLITAHGTAGSLYSQSTSPLVGRVAQGAVNGLKSPRNVMMPLPFNNMGDLKRR